MRILRFNSERSIKAVRRRESKNDKMQMSRFKILQVNKYKAYIHTLIQFQEVAEEEKEEAEELHNI